MVETKSPVYSASNPNPMSKTLSGFSISSDTLSGFFNDVKSNVVTILPVNINEIGIVANDEKNKIVNISGMGDLRANDEAIRSLMSMVGFNATLQQNMYNARFSTKDLTELSNTLRIHSDWKVGMIINTKLNQITGFSKSHKAVLPTKAFMDALLAMFDQNDMNPCHATLGDDGSIYVMARPDKVHSIAGLKMEDYRIGVEAKLSMSGARISPFYERLTCVNGMVSRCRIAGSFSCTKIEKGVKFLDALEEFRGFDESKFANKVKALHNIQASLLEVKNTVKSLASTFGVNMNPKQRGRVGELIATDIPYEAMSKVMEEKLHVSKPFKAISDNILQTMRSPMSYWDLVNAVTHVGTHVEELTTMSVPRNSRRKAIGIGGRMTFEDTPNLYQPFKQIF